jgi:uncharacterized protein (DUF362 family)
MTVHVAIDRAERLRSLVGRALAGRDLSGGVLIKPNIVFPVKERSGEITRHRFVRLVVEALRDLDAAVDIVIGEGTAAGTDPEENFRVSGYSDLAGKLGVRLVDLRGTDRLTVPWKFGRIRLPRIALERVLINLPILKASSAAVFSGAMKNLKGLLLPGTMKRFHMEGLHDRLAHLAALVKPDLTLLDLSLFCGKEACLAGDDTCEIDQVAAGILSVEKPEYMAAARRLGLGAEKPVTDGDDWLELKRDFSRINREFRKFLKLRLWSNAGACSMCRFALKRYLRFPPSANFREAAVTLRLFGYALTGAEIVFGKDPRFRADYRRIICFGDCTARLAAQGSNQWKTIHVPGCPPEPEDVARCLKYYT